MLMDHCQMMSSMLCRLFEAQQVRQLLQWLVDFHSQQNSQTSFTFFVPISSAMNQNCLPNLSRPYSKIATSLGAQFSKTPQGVTGLIRMSNSRFRYRWLTVSRQSSTGFFFFSGLLLKTSPWDCMTCRMGFFSALRPWSRQTQGWSSDSWLVLRMSSQILLKSGCSPAVLSLSLSVLIFLCGSAMSAVLPVYFI